MHAEQGHAQPAHQPEPPSATTLHGHRLVLARVVWLAVALLALGLFVARLPGRWAYAGTLDDAARANLARVGLSASAYAAFLVVRDVVYAAVCSAVGVVI